MFKRTKKFQHAAIMEAMTILINNFHVISTGYSHNFFESLTANLTLSSLQRLERKDNNRMTRGAFSYIVRWLAVLLFVLV